MSQRLKKLIKLKVNYGAEMYTPTKSRIADSPVMFGDAYGWGRRQREATQRGAERRKGRS